MEKTEFIKILKVFNDKLNSEFTVKLQNQQRQLINMLNI